MPAVAGVTAPEAVGPHGRYLHRSPRHTMVGPRLVHKHQAPLTF